MYEDIYLKGDKKTVLFEICQKIKVCYILLEILKYTKKIKVCYILMEISMRLSCRLGLGLPRTIREICTRNKTIERR
jgi:hypothetical protein